MLKTKIYKNIATEAKAVKFLGVNATGEFLSAIAIEEGVKFPVKLMSKNRPASLAKSFCFSCRHKRRNKLLNAFIKSSEAKYQIPNSKY